jgi:hypothetical protein
VLIAAYVSFFLLFVMFVVLGKLNQDDQILIYGAYFFSALIVSCVVFMSTYAIGYLIYLWRSGRKRKAVKGVFMFMLLNIMTGYIWFYWAEIKKRDIELG